MENMMEKYEKSGKCGKSEEKIGEFWKMRQIWRKNRKSLAGAGGLVAGKAVRLLFCGTKAQLENKGWIINRESLVGKRQIQIEIEIQT